MLKTISTIAIAASILFSSSAYAGDPSYPGAIERGTLGSPPIGSPDYPGIIERGNSRFSVGDDYFTSGRASGHMPASPDSVTETQHSDGSVSISRTYIKK